MPAKGSKVAWTTINCEYCGKEFEIRNCVLRRPQTHCCSRSCGYYLRLSTPEDILGNQRRPGVKRTYAKSWVIIRGYIRFNRGPYRNRVLHRVVMEKHLGRRLKSTETVHHIDCNKLNNTIDNLLLMTVSEHKKLHDKLRAEAKARKEEVCVN